MVSLLEHHPICQMPSVLLWNNLKFHLPSPKDTYVLLLKYWMHASTEIPKKHWEVALLHYSTLEALSMFAQGSFYTHWKFQQWKKSWKLWLMVADECITSYVLTCEVFWCMNFGSDGGLLSWVILESKEWLISILWINV